MAVCYLQYLQCIYSVAALNNELAKEQWLDIFEENNVNTAYEKFINKLKYYYDKNIPLVTIKKRINHAKKPLGYPWNP